MATYQKCPLCGRPLSPVGKKGARMKCDACHSVFDVSQLREYYGINSPNEMTPTAHDYETRHMHATEQHTRQQKAAQKAQQLKGDPPPVQSGNAFAETTRKVKAQAAAQQRPAPPTRQTTESYLAGHSTSSGKGPVRSASSSIVVIICIIVVLIVTLPILLDIFASILYMLP